MSYAGLVHGTRQRSRLTRFLVAVLSVVLVGVLPALVISAPAQADGPAVITLTSSPDYYFNHGSMAVTASIANYGRGGNIYNQHSVEIYLYGPDSENCERGTDVFHQYILRRAVDDQSQFLPDPLTFGPTTAFSPIFPGTYRWVVLYEGGEKAVRSACNAPGSVVVVKPTTIDLAISPSISLGDPAGLTAQASVFGHPTPGNRFVQQEMEYELYGPDSPTCDLSKKVLDVTDAQYIAGDHGELLPDPLVFKPSQTFMPTATGTYRWRVHYITYTGAFYTQRTPCNAPGTTVEVTSPVPDTTDPATTLGTTPSNPSRSSSAAFGFTGTDDRAVTGFQCSLDGADFAPCATGKDYSGLADGSHTFAVRASDGAGNLDPSPASYTWSVDTVAPTTTMGAATSGLITTSSASFAFTGADVGGSGVAGYECSLDHAAFSTCTSAVTPSGLGEGAHTFEVRARDVAGNVDASPATASWTVDTVAPDAQINSGPTGSVVATSGTFTYSSTAADRASFACKLDGNPVVCPASGYTFSGLGGGSHTFTVSAVDAAGNVGPAASRTFSISRTAQSITFNAPGSATYGAGDSSLGATASSGLPVSYTSTTTSVCTIVLGQLHVVSAGTCTIAADQAGNAGYTPAPQVVRSFTIGKATQSVFFVQPVNTVFEGADVPLSAAASSSLPVSFTSLTPATCSVVAGKAHPTGAGTCTIAVDQAGNGNVLAAARQTRSLSVAKAPITVTASSTSSLASLLTLRVVYTSTVKSATTGRPVAGVTVSTRIDGGSPTSGCTAITSSTGVATCTSGPIGIAVLTTYKATATESANYLGGTGSEKTRLF
ncbi:MAG: putative internalin [Marmoricola sp.]|nr:putative internalin [Marmoricola sp.]